MRLIFAFAQPTAHFIRHQPKGQGPLSTSGLINMVTLILANIFEILQKKVQLHRQWALAVCLLVLTHQNVSTVCPVVSASVKSAIEEESELVLVGADWYTCSILCMFGCILILMLMLTNSTYNEKGVFTFLHFFLTFRSNNTLSSIIKKNLKTYCKFIDNH